MAERVDDAELSMNQLEALKDMAIDNIRKQAQVVSQVFTGKCRYCNESIESGIYCAQWHREEQAAKQRKYGMRPAGFD
ncbi:TPA: hypothetical protein NKO27_004888 [Escherichia coli]|nr:hypothetical protein [Escherichia coli]HCH0612124.1 hypothetical protein [Escherichia coli]HCH0617384.1 hypothetical protein [Escherichia coli]HCH0623234.1 hypothetical protein [Escherichia coli]HCH0628352.1 hypothetical protein [Escherichia coli]